MKRNHVILAAVSIWVVVMALWFSQPIWLTGAYQQKAILDPWPRCTE